MRKKGDTAPARWPGARQACEESKRVTLDVAALATENTATAAQPPRAGVHGCCCWRRVAQVARSGPWPHCRVGIADDAAPTLIWSPSNNNAVSWGSAGDAIYASRGLKRAPSHDSAAQRPSATPRVPPTTRIVVLRCIRNPVSDFQHLQNIKEWTIQ